MGAKDACGPYSDLTVAWGEQKAGTGPLRALPAAACSEFVYYVFHELRESVYRLNGFEQEAFVRKDDAKRSRANAARLAKAKHRRTQPQTAAAFSSPLKLTLSVKLKRTWIRLKRWKKTGAGIAAVAISAFAAAPHFSIERATVNGHNPYLQDFAIQNQGWIPAADVDFRCAFPKDHYFVQNGAKIVIANLSIARSVAKIASKGQTFTANCGINAPNAIPYKGGITIYVDFYFPLFPKQLHSSQYFSSQYDSASAGYVMVPDTEH